MEPHTIFARFCSESSPQPILHPERCLRSRLNTNQCQRCLESCPSNALRIESRKIRLDGTQCTGCMACISACPQDGFTSDHTLDQLLSPFRTRTEVVISCTHQGQSHPDEMTIPCVGILSKQLLAAILLSDCRSVSFNLSGCSECRNREVSNVFMRDCKRTIQELSDLNSTKVDLFKTTEKLSTFRIDRRSYLAKIREIIVDVSKRRSLSKLPAPLVEPKGGRRIPLKTQIVKEVLTKLDEDSQKKILSLFCYNLSISEDCNCCPLCKGICPTGAINIDRSGKNKNFRFEMLNCNGCGLCVEFCKKSALSLEHFSAESPGLRYVK